MIPRAEKSTCGPPAVIVVSPRGGGFNTAVDTGLIALVPRRLVQGRADRLQLVECPSPVAGFSITLLWHERNHAHAARRWVREKLIAATAVA